MTAKEQFTQDMNALADSINSKANSIGKKTIAQLKEAVDSISAGGGSVELLKSIIVDENTPVPNTGHLEKIFFNTKLTTDQVDSLIANANLRFINGGSGMFFYPILRTDTKFVAIADLSSILGTESGSSWVILDVGGSGILYYASPSAESFAEIVGWDESAFTSFETGEVTIGADLLEEENGIEIGKQNNLLTTLVSSSLFVDTEEKTEVVKSLTDQYKLVEKNIRLDTGDNTSYSYDFVNNINEDTKEINIIKNIEVDSRDDEIINRSVNNYSNSRVKKIGAYAFSSCEVLVNASFPNVDEIEEYAFFRCSNLENIDLPLVTVINGGAFQGCVHLGHIDLPQVTTMGMQAFSGCHYLVSITAPLLEDIPNEAFRNCDALNFKSVEFPKAKTVGERSFLRAEWLQEAILPQINNIGLSAFSNCYSLVKLFISQKDSICTLSSSAFDNCYHILGTGAGSQQNHGGLKDGYIYVPASLLSQYKVATYWTTYATQIIGHEDLEAGASLPDYTTDSFTTQTWYSDEKLTTVVTEVATTGTYYCRLEA